MLTRIYIAAGALAAALILAAGSLVVFGSSRSAEVRNDAPQAVRQTSGQDAAPADPGAGGVLVIASQGGLATYRPDGKVVSPQAQPGLSPPQGLSADGRWTAVNSCPNPSLCQLSVGPASGGVFRAVASNVQEGVWSSSAAAQLAIRDATGALFIYDASGDKLTPLAQSVTGFLWSGNDLTYATREASGSTFWSFNGKTARQLMTTPCAIERFYPSPSATSLAFICSAHDGWTLSTLDLASGVVTSFGNLGAVSERGATAQEPPEIAIAWSPDEKQIAVSPVSATYVLHLLAADGTSQRRYFFEEGYAGELVWSPSGDVLAISTYSSDRSRHEVYVLDVAGTQAPRHLLDGCHIEWSPDGRYMAVKREPSKAPGVSAIRVEDGANWPVVAYTGYVPISWGANEADAMALALKPANPSAVLGK